MDYKIIGQTVPVVEMKLNKGETVYTQSGGMTYKSEGITMATNTRGGEDRREGGRKGRRERGGRRAERKERREAAKAAGGNN